MTSALIAHCDNRPFWTPAGTNKDDLECLIHLKLRFTDGTLDVRTLWLSDSTICIGVARGGRVDWRVYSLESIVPLPLTWEADALFLCGRWASC